MQATPVRDASEKKRLRMAATVIGRSQSRSQSSWTKPKLNKKAKTLAAYTTALNYFTESCPKLFVQDIERADLLKFCAFLRDKKKQAPRSVYNKFDNVMTFLKANGI